MNWKIIRAVYILLIFILVRPVLSAGDTESRNIAFDRAAIHAKALEESIQPIRPGASGKVQFWNSRSTSFIYAPAFDFKPVTGAMSYRFIITAYGPKSWTFEDTKPQILLESMWKDLPEGKILTKLAYQNDKGRWQNSRQKSQWLEKKVGVAAPTLDFNEEKGKGKYRFTIQVVKILMFESDAPSAPLTPVWKDVPDGMVSLSVEGLDKKGGKRIALATIGKGTTRQFERRVAFNGPYHEAAMDYIEAGTRWLKWLKKSHYRKWKKEGDPENLGKYPCKVEPPAVKGLIALSLLESNPAKKEELLQMARNAARTLIKGSYPADWGLAYLPPTYGSHKPGPLSYGTVMMTYPADAGNAYLDLYEAVKEQEFLDAAVRIADVYKRTQLANGSWPLLMEGKSGKKTPRSKTSIMPAKTIMFLDRLIDDHGFKSYQPVVQAGWEWVKSNVLMHFQFEGQFEDTVANKGGNPWHVSHHSANPVRKYLLQQLQDDLASVPLAEEILRWSEDQFIFWETPGIAKKAQFTPRGVEQHNGPLRFRDRGYSTEAGAFISAYQELYEATGKELYLAKAIAFANAMTVLQKTKYGGNYVSTDWGWGKGWGGWVNCHTYNAMTLVKLGQMLEEHNMHVTVNPDTTAEIE